MEPQASTNELSLRPHESKFGLFVEINITSKAYFSPRRNCIASSRNCAKLREIAAIKWTERLLVNLSSIELSVFDDIQFVPVSDIESEINPSSISHLTASIDPHCFKRTPQTNKCYLPSKYHRSKYLVRTLHGGLYLTPIQGSLCRRVVEKDENDDYHRSSTTYRIGS